MYKKGSKNPSSLTEYYVRFFSRVSILPGENECWLWTGAMDKRKYGRFYFNGRLMLAHRFLISVPKGKMACHKCDNPQCVRPSHIFIGTQFDNMRDCSAKGRLRPWNGLRVILKATRKLTDEAVRDIRSTAYLKRGAQVQLAKKYGVAPCTISDVLAGRHYRHVK